LKQHDVASFTAGSVTYIEPKDIVEQGEIGLRVGKNIKRRWYAHQALALNGQRELINT
jgi:hypothetical protein